MNIKICALVFTTFFSSVLQLSIAAQSVSSGQEDNSMLPSGALKMEIASVEHHNPDTRHLNTEKSLPVKNINITIDGEVADWKDVPMLSTNGYGGLVALKAYDDDSYIYILIQGKTDANYVLFLNTDDNTDSGFQHRPGSPEGADYSIENGELFKYKGKGTNWRWNSKGGKGLRSVKTENAIEVKIEKSKLPNLASWVGIGIDIESNDWNTLAAMPDAGSSLAYYQLLEEPEQPSDPWEVSGSLEQTENISLSANPFNSLVDFRLMLPETTDITIEVYDLAGSKVYEIHRKAEPAGLNVYGWNGTDSQGRQLNGDIYIGKVKIGDKTETIRLLKY